MSNASILVPMPALLLLVGALSAARPIDAVVAWRRGLVVALAVAAWASASALVAWTVLTADTLRFSVSPWSPDVFGGAPELRVDALAALALWLVCAVAVGVVVRGPVGGDISAAAGPLLVAWASALFVSAADSPLGLVFAWLLLDATLFVSGRPHARGWLLGHVGLAMAVVGLLTMPFDAGPGGATITTVDAAGRWWLLGAAAVRMGLYPLWWSLPRTEHRPWRALGTRVAPTVAGAYLVLRIAEGVGLFEGPGDRTLAPIGVALVGGSLLAWLAAHRGESMDWQLTIHAALLTAAGILGGSVGLGIGVVLLLDLVLSRGVLYASEGMADGSLNRVARWIAVASASALPLTIGFAARWLLYRELLVRRQMFVLLFTVAASALSTMALWDTQRVRAPTGRESRSTSVALLVPAAAILLLGLSFGPGQRLFDAVGARAPVTPLLELRSLLSQPSTAISALQLLGLILFPMLMAVVVQRTPLGWIDRRRRAARHALELTTLTNTAAGAVIRAGETVHRATGLLESERAMAWTLMAVAVSGAAMLVGASGPGAASTAWTWGTLVPYAVACVLSAALLFGTSAGVLIATLAGAYALASVATMRTAGLGLIGLIQLLVGVLITGILAISVVQAYEAGSVHDAWRCLLDVPSRVFEGRSLPLMGLTLVVGLIMALGVRTETLAGSLPDHVLRTGLALIVGGALTVVFARRPVRLAAGTLFTLAGFGLVYAHVDAGYFITGGLAVFQLLFALVASYHVGLAIEAERA